MVKFGLAALVLLPAPLAGPGIGDLDVASFGPDQATLKWVTPELAPGFGNLIAFYDIRYSTPGEDFVWDSAHPLGKETIYVSSLGTVENVYIPTAEVGDPEIFEVANPDGPGFGQGDPTRFALKFYAIGFNAWSDLSNVETANWDATAPSAVVPALVGEAPGSLTVAWTAPGDDGDGPPGEFVTGYEVRYSAVPPRSDVDAWWNAVTTLPVLGFSPTVPPGETETLEISGLSAGSYYVAVMCGDEVPHWSPLSPVIEGTVSSANAGGGSGGGGSGGCASGAAGPASLSLFLALILIRRLA